MKGGRVLLDYDLGAIDTRARPISWQDYPGDGAGNGHRRDARQVRLSDPRGLGSL
jgi:hypothetical protein